MRLAAFPTAGHYERDFMGESLEALFARAHALLSDGRLEECCALLREARSEALQRGDRGDAGLFSGLLGAALAQHRRGEAALEEFLAAEQYDPDSAERKIVTARHLLGGLGRAVSALDKAREALALVGTGGRGFHSLQSLIGEIWLSLGEPTEAVAAFRAMTMPNVLAALRADTCDLKLVERLVRNGLALDLCREYLHTVLAKAHEERNDLVQQDVRGLLRLSGGTTSGGGPGG